MSLAVGKRTEEKTRELVADFRRRTGGRPMRLMTSDERSQYETAIREEYGREVVPPRTGRRGRPRKASATMPPEIVYATVCKIRKKGRVVRVRTRIVFGTFVATVLALLASTVSAAINTSFVERHHGTDRHRCSRKARKTYAFSKDWETHRAATTFSYFSYNYCWPVRTLRQKGLDGRWRPRTPAMAAGLADHVWSLAEWLTFPGVQRR